MPGFVKTQKDEDIWKKAKKQAKKKGLKGDSFYAYANTVFHRMKGIEENKEVFDHEEDSLAGFKTWFDSLPKKERKMLKRTGKNKFDSTKEIQPDADGKPLYKKKEKVTVWGAPKDFNYIRN